MTELQMLAALNELDRKREHIRARISQGPGARHVLVVLGGLAVGWLARGLMLGSGR